MKTSEKMKYTIEGFSQKKAVELGLTCEDLVILRWFVDFWPSPKMVKMQADGKTYALVSYQGFIEQMPIIGCNKRTIARKFQRLVESKVLENVTIRQNGSFSVYRFGLNYESLVHKNDTVVDSCTEGVVQSCTEGLSKVVQPNTPPLNTLQLNNSKGVHFVPPSVEEVTAYCRERNNGIDPEQFFDFYTANGWVQGKGKKMKDWKAAVRTWERNRKESGNMYSWKKQQEEDPYADYPRF